MLPPIVYVDDDNESRQVMKILLTKRLKLQHVTIYDDGHNFRERIQGLNPLPGLFILDIHLKSYTGFELLKIIRETPIFNSVPVVALTASVMNEEIELLHAAGFSGCLAKPLDLDNFPQMIERILAGESVWHVF